MPRVAPIAMTPAWLSALKPAATGEYPDSVQRGLRLRVRDGRMVWSARYLADGRHVRFRLGEYPEVGLSEARKRAAKARGKASGDEDPQAERRLERQEAKRRRMGANVERAIRSWLRDKKHGPSPRWKGGLKGGTWAMPHVNRLRRDFGAIPVEEFDARHAERFVSAPESPATRNRALTVLRLLLTWARRKRLMTGDPTELLRKERELERTRTLADHELAALVRGFDATRYGRAVRLLALTGLRRDEVLGARWSWLDAEGRVLTIPPEAEKTGRTRGEARRVALSKAAADLLADQREALFAEGLRSSEYMFATSTGSRPHADALKPILYRLRGRRSNGLEASRDKRAKPRQALLPDDVTIHDVRRTVADALLNRLRVSPWVVDHVVLGHARPKLLRTYMPTLPLEEAREALERWASEVARILSDHAHQAKA